MENFQYLSNILGIFSSRNQVCQNPDDKINNLPPEVMLHIFSYACSAPTDLANVSGVCKRWNVLSKDGNLLKEIENRIYPKSEEEEFVVIPCESEFKPTVEGLCFYLKLLLRDPELSAGLDPFKKIKIVSDKFKSGEISAEVINNVIVQKLLIKLAKILVKKEPALLGSNIEHFLIKEEKSRLEIAEIHARKGVHHFVRYENNFGRCFKGYRIEDERSILKLAKIFVYSDLYSFLDNEKEFKIKDREFKRELAEDVADSKLSMITYRERPKAN